LLLRTEKERKREREREREEGGERSLELTGEGAGFVIG
jgi:hypothetical protein